MKKNIFIVFLLIGIGQSIHAQTSYYGKIESGYLRYFSNTITVDPGPNWKGYYLNNVHRGYDVSLTNGLCFRNAFYTGIGGNYINFSGIKGLSLFTDIEYVPAHKRLTNMYRLKIGYSHLLNQYENGTTTALVEFGIGKNYWLSDNTALYLQIGLLMTQQSCIIPMRLGCRF
jgi:hypothetical protein